MGRATTGRCSVETKVLLPGVRNLSAVHHVRPLRTVERASKTSPHLVRNTLWNLNSPTHRRRPTPLLSNPPAPCSAPPHRPVRAASRMTTSQETAPKWGAGPASAGRVPWSGGGARAWRVSEHPPRPRSRRTGPRPCRLPPPLPRPRSRLLLPRDGGADHPASRALSRSPADPARPTTASQATPKADPSTVPMTSRWTPPGPVPPSSEYAARRLLRIPARTRTPERVPPAR